MTAPTVLDILPRRPRPIAALERYQGLSAPAGTRIAGWDHLRQSILDILSTYPGERIMRPEYGSRIRDLIDRPVNAQWLADLYFEVAYAIARWEPRVKVQRVAATMDTPGHVTLDLTLRLGAQDQPQTLRVEV